MVVVRSPTRVRLRFSALFAVSRGPVSTALSPVVLIVLLRMYAFAQWTRRGVLAHVASVDPWERCPRLVRRVHQASGPPVSYPERLIQLDTIQRICARVKTRWIRIRDGLYLYWRERLGLRTSPGPFAVAEALWRLAPTQGLMQMGRWAGTVNRLSRSSLTTCTSIHFDD